jgi:hypothetical protein
MPILISFPSLSAALGDVVSSSDTITGFVIWAVSGVPLDPGSRLSASEPFTRPRL